MRLLDLYIILPINLISFFFTFKSQARKMIVVKFYYAINVRSNKLGEYNFFIINDEWIS